MKFLKWKIIVALAAACSLGTMATAVSCSSNTMPKNLTSQYEIALRTLTEKADATGDYRGLKIDAYYWNLKKGEFVKILMKKMRFDENGTWTADFDPFVEILSLLNPKTSWSFTFEEETKLLDALYSYLYVPMDLFLRNNVGVLAAWSHSVAPDMENKKPTWKVEITFPWNETKLDGSKLINGLLEEWTSKPAYTNGYLATEFGLLSVPISIRPFKKKENESISETAVKLIEPVMDLDMYGYILSRPDLGVSFRPNGVGLEGKYELQWYLQEPPFESFPVYMYYSDKNKYFTYVNYEITFYIFSEQRPQQ